MHDDDRIATAVERGWLSRLPLRLDARIALYVFKWELWVLVVAVRIVLKHGNVRQIRRTGEQIRELGETAEEPYTSSVGQSIVEKAEEIVLRRKRSWRIRS